jgi:hypothetical protein
MWCGSRWAVEVKRERRREGMADLCRSEWRRRKWGEWWRDAEGFDEGLLEISLRIQRGEEVTLEERRKYDEARARTLRGLERKVVKVRRPSWEEEDRTGDKGAGKCGTKGGI